MNKTFFQVNENIIQAGPQAESLVEQLKSIIRQLKENPKKIPVVQIENTIPNIHNKVRSYFIIIGVFFFH